MMMNCMYDKHMNIIVVGLIWKKLANLANTKVKGTNIAYIPNPIRRVSYFLESVAQAKNQADGYSYHCQLNSCSQETMLSAFQHR